MYVNDLASLNQSGTKLEELKSLLSREASKNSILREAFRGEEGIVGRMSRRLVLRLHRFRSGTRM